MLSVLMIAGEAAACVPPNPATCSPICNGSAVPAIDAGFQEVKAARTEATQQIVEAIGALQSGTVAAHQARATARRQGRVHEIEGQVFADSRADYRRFNADTTPSLMNTSCRIGTANAVAPSIEAYSQATLDGLVEGPTSSYFSHNFTEDRFKLTNLQRVCRNGMLRPGDYGTRWFTANHCFEDVAAAGGTSMTHAFMGPSVIFDNLVFVQPSRADMTCFNDPENCAPIAGNAGANQDPVQQRWNALTPKQKSYVAAVRYCEALEASAMKPLTYNGDHASDPRNMHLILKSFSAMAKLNAVLYACHSEIARRVAPNPNMLPAATADGPDLQGDPRRVVQGLVDGGMDPALFEDGGVRYASPAVLQIARAQGYCTNPQVQIAMHQDDGDQNVTSGNMLECAALPALADQRDSGYRDMLLAVTSKIDKVAADFPAGPDAVPAKTGSRDATVMPVNFIGFDESESSEPTTLREILRRTAPK